MQCECARVTVYCCAGDAHQAWIGVEERCLLMREVILLLQELQLCIFSWTACGAVPLGVAGCLPCDSYNNSQVCSWELGAALPNCINPDYQRSKLETLQAPWSWQPTVLCWQLSFRHSESMAIIAVFCT